MSDQEQVDAASGEGIDPSVEHLIKEGRNKLAIFLPHMKKKCEDQKPEDGECYTSHWVVDNMYKFENIGFSNTVGTIKYLICADCEVNQRRPIKPILNMFLLAFKQSLFARNNRFSMFTRKRNSHNSKKSHDNKRNPAKGISGHHPAQAN
ncbi:hypothetical protein LSH36_216g07073 [Paralvinella palmiformis]|uniref:Uncharacterized protein n=1 Tax=Paralvinella palmiformis TaxID=53620 RepID=A0AAD9JNK7_9ANNE|nr:hypothetical protein LSH36_216g07073 [Paralvinella palmiformis]